MTTKEEEIYALQHLGINMTALSTDNIENDNHKLITMRVDTLPFQTSIESPKIAHDKHSTGNLHDLLNGYSVYDDDGQLVDIRKRLSSIDECLEIITNTWNDEEILTKHESDIKHLLNNTDIDELHGIYKNDIYEELYALALKIKQMNFIIRQQEMIYLPVKCLYDVILSMLFMLKLISYILYLT